MASNIKFNLKYIVLSVKMAFVKYLNISLCSVLLFYILIVSAYAIYDGIHDGGLIRIGFYSEQLQPEENDVFERFVKCIDGIIDVQYYTDMEKMRIDVLKNNIQTGYALYPDDEDIHVYTTEQSFTATITNFLLASVFMQEQSGEKGYEVVRTLTDEYPKQYVVEDIQKRSEQFFQNITDDAVSFAFVNELPLGMTKIESAPYIYIHICFWSLVFLVLTADILRLKANRYSVNFTAMKINVKQFLFGQILGAAIITAAFFWLSVMIIAVIN